MAHTALKTHLLKMCDSSYQYESVKAEEALQGSNKTVHVMHRVNALKLVQVYERLSNWKPTITSLR
jgi:hypothetical protein